MYGRGHVRGTKRHRPAEATWYASIARQTLATLAATWPHDTDPTAQEVTHDETPHSVDNDDSDSMTTALTMTTAR